MRLFPKDCNQKKKEVSPFHQNLGNADKGIIFPQKKGNTSEKRYIGLVRHLGKAVRHHLPQFWEILTFRSPDGVRVQSGVGALFRYFM